MIKAPLDRLPRRCRSRAGRLPAAAATAVALLVAALGGAGCNSNAATAALATTVGIGAASTLATQSHVTVKVEMFNELNLCETHRGKFEDKKSVLARRVMQCYAERERAFAEVVLETIASDRGGLKAALKEHQQELDRLRANAELVLIDASAENTTALRGGVRNIAVRLRDIARADAERARNAARDPATLSPENVMMTPAGADGGGAATAAAAFSAIASSANSGPLADEIMQVVLTKREMLDIVTHEGMKTSWTQFAEASSHGGTGNHHAVVYFENMGLPILKSSEFNPSKFVEAFGHTYEVAFNALASAYGVPVSGATGSGTEGLDAVSQGFARDKQLARAKKVRGALLDTVDAVADAYTKNAPADLKTEIAAASATALSTKLNELATTLENVDTK